MLTLDPACVCALRSAVCSKVQAALQELHASLSRAEQLLTSGAAAGEIEPLLTAARVDMSQIHVDVKDLSQTITIVEEVRHTPRRATQARVDVRIL